MMRAELAEGLGHLRLAAAHGAQGVGQTVGPRLRDVGRTAALVPMAVATARAGAAKAGKRSKKASVKTKESKMSRKRTRLVVGLLVAGAAAGLAGALIARRRSRSRWEEYEAQGRTAAHDDMAARADGATAMNPDWTDNGRHTTPTWAAPTRDAGTEKADARDLDAGQFPDTASTLSGNNKV